MTNVAEVLVQTLILSGVKRVYGLPGDSLNGITDSIRTHSEVQWVHVRNEEAAAFAAGADAHLTGRLAVCAGSCGPGNLHFINGLYDCHRSRVPVLAIAAQIPSQELCTTYFQETYPEQLFKDCSHYCGVVSEPEQMPRVLGIAMRAAIARRGVAVIVIPGNISMKACSVKAVGLGFLENRSSVVPPESDLLAAASVLNESKRVTGLIGWASGYRAMMHCDTLLALGTDFPYPQFYPEKAKKIQVDVRGEQIGRRTTVDIGLIGTVKETIEALLPKLTAAEDDEHLRKSLDHYRESRKDLDELATGRPGSTPLHPQYVAKVLDEVADEHAVFTVDVGTPSIWAARYLHFNGKRRLVGSWSHGSMAGALPQALGAQAAFPGRQVIAMAGDGGLAMGMGELLTAVQNKLPVKIVVFNNEALAFVEVEMIAAGIVPFGTDLKNPEFSKVAEACGLLGLRVSKPEELRPALYQALRYEGPALVEVMVHRQELSMPPTITAAQALGFSLYLTKSVLNGRGDAILDLAKTNLLDRLRPD